MKYLSLIGIVSILACLSQVQSFSHYILMAYYDCKNSFSNTPPKDWYYIENFLPDSFYNKTLGSINSFQAAMDHFRSLFTEIRNCTQNWCYCSRYYLHYDSFPDYTFFFTNATIYPQMYSILNAVKTNYKLLNMNQIIRQTNNTHFDEFWDGYDFMNAFSTKYDFTWQFLYFYNETFKCEDRVNQIYWDCHENYLTLDYYDSRPNSNYSRAAFEDFISCLLTNISDCNTNIKRSIGLTNLYENPKVIQGNNLTTYIDQLASRNRPLSFRRFMSWTDFGFEFYSYAKKTVEYCQFDKGVTYTLFETASIKIEGVAVERKLSTGTAFNMIPSFTFTFTSSSKTQKYTAGIGSIPIGFDSKGTMMINGTNNQKWLQMISYNDPFHNNEDIDSVVIIDSSSNTTFLVYDCHKHCLIDVIAPTNTYTKGILTQGCTKKMRGTTVNEIFNEYYPPDYAV